MSEYINNIISEIQKDERIHSAFLLNHDGCSTNWSINKSARNPGFFTPFNEKTMGIKQALLATVLMPVMKLGNALLITIHTPITLFSALMESIFRCQLNPLLEGAGLILFAYPVNAIYFSGAFVLNLLKEICALITRSIASLIHVLMNIGSSSNNINAEDNECSNINNLQALDLEIDIGESPQIHSRQ